jgi:hypothetical protein
MLHSVLDDGAPFYFDFQGTYTERHWYFYRICPGRFMAFSAIWIAVASLIAAFDITKAVDENGEIIEPIQKYVSALAV